MKRHTYIIILLVMLPSFSFSILLDSDVDIAAIEKALHKVEKKKSVSALSSELIEFKYEQKDIKDLLNEFAQKLNINILYPETEVVNSKVTFDAGKKITVSEAWDFVTMILEQAGYSLVLRGAGIYGLVANAKSYSEPLPLYIGVNFNQLPDTVERIRFVYYFNNIQLSKQKAELNTILANFLSAQNLEKQLILDETLNLMVLTVRSEIVKSVMHLVSILDEVGFTESVDMIKLEHANAGEVVRILKEVMGTSSDKKPGAFVSLSSGQRAKYFSEFLRIEDLDPKNIRHLNTIIVMGKPHDVEEVRKFVKKYLDIHLDKGSSFFHVIELEWLNATKFVTVLQNLTQTASGTAGQSTSTLASDLGFDPHIRIVSEAVSQGTDSTTQQLNSGNTTNPTPTVQRGANKLVIACTPRDWERIEPLIKKLDIPQKQVIIEALIMDLDLRFVRKLGVQMRTQGLVSTIFPKNMQAQAGLLLPNIIQPNATDPGSYSLLGDLSDILNPEGLASGSGSLTTPNVSTSLTPAGMSGSAATAFTGNTIFMVNGGKQRTNGVWSFFQLLSSHTSAKVFTRPVLMALNNQQASVTSSIVKNLAGPVTSGTNPTVTYTQEPATISIQFTPLISDNDTVNLGIVANLTVWYDADAAKDGTKIKRLMSTNVSMKSGDVLVLGGLIKEQAQVSKRSVPFFENIPIIGNLFTSRAKDSTRDQLFILIRTTVIAPRLQGGMGLVTRTAADFMIDQLAEVEDAFAGLKDPVTRWFFNSDRDDSPSEYLTQKVEELPAYDFKATTQDDSISQKQKAKRKSEQKGGDIKIGWFSDVKSNNKAASQAGSSSTQDMDALSKMLKDMENPFEKRLQV